MQTIDALLSERIVCPIIERIKKVKVNVVDMFEARGFRKIRVDGDEILAEKQNGDGVCCFISHGRKFNTQHINFYISEMNKYNIKHGIMVYDESTPNVKKMIDVFIDYYIELFSLDELQYNITKHSLVPRHTALTAQESSEIKEKKKLPYIYSSDPICRYYDIRKGSVVKIDDGILIWFRLVV